MGYGASHPFSAGCAAAGGVNYQNSSHFEFGRERGRQKMTFSKFKNKLQVTF